MCIGDKIMKYIENIDEEFVLDFAKENLKDMILFLSIKNKLSIWIHLLCPHILFYEATLNQNKYFL